MLVVIFISPNHWRNCRQASSNQYSSMINEVVWMPCIEFPSGPDVRGPQAVDLYTCPPHQLLYTFPLYQAGCRTFLYSFCDGHVILSNSLSKQLAPFFFCKGFLPWQVILVLRFKTDKNKDGANRGRKGSMFTFWFDAFGSNKTQKQINKKLDKSYVRDKSGMSNFHSKTAFFDS